MYEKIVKGQNILEPGIPESFKVLTKELQESWALRYNPDIEWKTQIIKQRKIIWKLYTISSQNRQIQRLFSGVQIVTGFPGADSQMVAWRDKKAGNHQLPNL